VTTSVAPPPPWLGEVWTDKLGVRHDYALWLEDVKYTNKTALIGNYTEIITFEPIFLEGESDFKVYAGEVHYGFVPDLDKYTADGVNWTVTIDLGAFAKSIGCSNDSTVTWPLDMETVHVKCLKHTLHVKAYIKVTTYPDGTTTNSTKLRGYIETCYKEKLGGRYEWTIVGKDARTIDSVGAALVTAAFKNKQVEIGVGGLDMVDETWGPMVPYILRRMGYPSWRLGAPAGRNWYDSTGRLHLVDDWCTSWPVSSSNIITVGGSPANLVSEYFNEFTDAIFIHGIVPPKTTDELKDKIFAVSCWAKKAYGEGYAVITTYKDLNGTVGLLIYGYTGQDTYYACKWFHEDGIYQLQEAPECLTTIILKIDYTKHPPSISIVECLGTISEALWTHGSEKKGGIHDP
jgi:hypothetical protein